MDIYDVTSLKTGEYDSKFLVLESNLSIHHPWSLRPSIHMSTQHPLTVTYGMRQRKQTGGLSETAVGEVGEGSSTSEDQIGRNISVFLTS